MKGSIQLVIIVCAVLFSAACATGPKQIVRSVCVEIAGLPQHEVEFMLKRTQVFLTEFNLVQSSSGECDVTTKYQPFGNFQAEEIAFIGKSGYWSQEGSVTVTRDGRPVVEDYPINLRGYDSRQALLDAVAWQVVKPVSKAFKGNAPSK
jgi:hypothetical protein